MAHFKNQDVEWVLRKIEKADENLKQSNNSDLGFQDVIERCYQIYEGLEPMGNPRSCRAFIKDTSITKREWREFLDGHVNATDDSIDNLLKRAFSSYFGKNSWVAK